MRRFLGHSLLTLLFALASLTAYGAPGIALRVRPLRPAGGVERDLPARLTTALTRFLHDHAETSLRIESPARPEQAATRDTLLRYNLEGDLSYASGPNDAGGRYLLVARLTREGRPAALIGQWAGSADTLRYLTANLRNDPRVHTLGLIGEIGSRVLAAVTTDAASPEQQWRRLTPVLSSLRTPRVTTEVAGTVRADLIIGTPTHLRLQPATDNRAYVMAVCSGGRLQAIPLTWTHLSGADLTTSQPISLPADTREAWLLCERKATEPIQRLQTGLMECHIMADEDDVPVHVLNGIGTSTHAPQETLRLLMAELRHDPNDWCVLRLNVAPHP